MGYDVDLANRLRAQLSRSGEPFTERAMFGGLGFMLGGHMAVAASGAGGLLLRCAPDDTEARAEASGVERFEMRGRPMNGWLHVSREVVADDESLARWVAVGTSYAAGLLPKTGEE
jgi:hypothetical protein